MESERRPDHLGRLREDNRRNRDAKLLGRLQVDDQLKRGPLTTIADASGAYCVLGNPSTNNRGTVAFVAILDTGDSGVFTGPNPVADKVIGTGDFLAGAMVTEVGSWA